MTQVKICGLTNLDDATVAAAAGADLLGFIFYPPSPRNVTTETARQIVAHVHRLYPGVRCVGVFVDQAPQLVLRTVRRCGLDTVQLHGSEPPATTATLLNAQLDVIRAVRIRDETSLAEISQQPASALLLDTFVAGQPGGTGKTFDWSLAARLKANRPVILAGGLTADNVAQAIQLGRPWGVDVSSGVESHPGRKDHHELQRFISNAKQ